jgi:cyclopropane fatty-acyl-phospholipid synthase-like methyltransferase
VTRTPEPELMLGEEQAEAYAAADLSELQQSMVALFAARFGAPAGGCMLDLGCGAADMTIRFATAYPGVAVLGVDGSPPLLRQAERAIRVAGLEGRVRVEQRHLPDAALETGRFDAVIANSLLHHLADPATLWRTALRCAAPHAPVLVMDLRRPPDAQEAERLVALHAREAWPILQQDFFNSLRAAYRADEIRAQLDAAGLSDFQVEEIGDLHVLAWGRAHEIADNADSADKGNADKADKEAPRLG